MHRSGCSKQVNFPFLFGFKRTKNVNAFSPLNPSVVTILDTLMLRVVVLNEHQVLVFCSLAVPCLSAFCYLVQQQVASDSWYWTLSFSPVHFCLYSGACSKLFMIKHCSNSQVKIY